MDLIRINLLLRLIIILKLFTGISSLIFPKPSDTLSKSIICIVENGDTNIKEIPSQCTCIASYTSNTKTSASQIQTLRKDLQYLLIIDNYEYETIKDYVTSDKITEFIDKICDTIKTYGANGVLFNRMNSDDHDGRKGDPNGEFQQGVQIVFRELRKKNKGLVIGLGLTNNEKILKHAFTQEFIGPDVDFFVATTVIFTRCQLIPANRVHPNIITKIVDLKNIEATLDMMHKHGFTYDKLIYIIRVIVQSDIYNNGEHFIETSYSDMCSKNHKFSTYRFYCTETLQNFYLMGKLVYDLKMNGVVMQSVDNDDYIANCGTEKFPVLQAIKAGVDGEPEPTKITSEPRWATTSEGVKN